jgi:hypothetical protein
VAFSPFAKLNRFFPKKEAQLKIYLRELNGAKSQTSAKTPADRTSSKYCWTVQQLACSFTKNTFGGWLNRL